MHNLPAMFSNPSNYDELWLTCWAYCEIDSCQILNLTREKKMLIDYELLNPLNIFWCAAKLGSPEDFSAIEVVYLLLLLFIYIYYIYIFCLSENKITCVIIYPPQIFLGDFDHVFSRAWYILKCHICCVQQTVEVVYAQVVHLNGI